MSNSKSKIIPKQHSVLVIFRWIQMFFDHAWLAERFLQQKSTSQIDLIKTFHNIISTNKILKCSADETPNEQQLHYVVVLPGIRLCKAIPTWWKFYSAPAMFSYHALKVSHLSNQHLTQICFQHHYTALFISLNNFMSVLVFFFPVVRLPLTIWEWPVKRKVRNYLIYKTR